MRGFGAFKAGKCLSSAEGRWVQRRKWLNFLITKYSKVQRHNLFLWKTHKEIYQPSKCPNTMPNNFYENLIYITMTFKRNNLDRTDYSVVFNIPYNPHIKLSSLSYSLLLKCANKSGGNVVSAYKTVQSLGKWVCLFSYPANYLAFFWEP